MHSILIAGGTGLVGSYLSKLLQDKGYSVSFLSRKPASDSKNTFYWNYKNNEIDSKAIQSADYIIHLAGASLVDKRWSEDQKQEILDSRILTSKLIYNEVKNQDASIKAFISASAIGYYGAITSEKIYQETDDFYDDFLGNVCHEWETVSREFNSIGVRNVSIRTGLVLSDKGGALVKLSKIFKKGLGSPLGTGKQYMPWIHIEDLCEIFIKAIEDDKMSGPYNAIAPEHITNNEFSKTLAEVLKKPFWMPKVPAFVLKVVLGELSVMLLQGSRVSAKKIIETGYKFKYISLKNALLNLINK